MVAKPFCSILVVACSLFGCSHDARQALEGAVSLDGQPLSEGSINFMPLAGTNSPTTGANIQEGRFVVARESGALPGKFRVEIVAKRKNGQRILSDTAGGLVDQYEQFLPARYNRDSQLTADVTSGVNRFVFSLTSQ